MLGKAEPLRGKGQLFAMKQAPYKNFIWPLTNLEVVLVFSLIADKETNALRGL